jgi:aryl-alcohol dehydrogenase-like predicted oxidoreductase
MAVIQELKKANKIKDADVIGGIHCIHQAFLEDQLTRSLQNLKVETLDLLYLHNPVESQLPALNSVTFDDRLRAAFEFLEKVRRDGKIKAYGLATWLSLRSPVPEVQLHLSLEKTLRLAEEVGGKSHGLEYVQVPINIMMPEAFVHKWQELAGVPEILLNVAKSLQINVISSSPLLQGQMLELPLTKPMPGVDSNAGKHIQIVRSVPSSALKSTLIGMKSPQNVAMNLKLGEVSPLSAEEFWNYLKPPGSESGEVVIKLW